MFHVVAGNHQEYLHWLTTTKCNRIDCVYVADVQTLRGLLTINGLFIGTAYDRQDIGNILEQINTIRARMGKTYIFERDIAALSCYPDQRYVTKTTIPAVASKIAYRVILDDTAGMTEQTLYARAACRPSWIKSTRNTVMFNYEFIFGDHSDAKIFIAPFKNVSIQPLNDYRNYVV